MLLQKTLYGVKWTTMSMIFLSFCQILQLAVSARFLTQFEFGLISIIVILINFSQSFMDFGISSALIHYQKITHVQISSLYWLNIFSGISLTIIMFFLAPKISNYYGASSLELPLKILSFVYFLISIGSQYKVLAQKKLNFKMIAKVEIFSALVSLVFFFIGIFFYRVGIYSIVFSMLINHGVTSLLFLTIGINNGKKPLLVYSQKTITKFIQFGLYQMGERGINYFSSNLDKLLISKMLGIELLGIYNIAWQLVIFPMTRINPVINKVVFPIYSGLQNDTKILKKYYLSVFTVVNLVNTPLFLYIGFFSHDILLVIFGSGWDKAELLIIPLVYVGMLKSQASVGATLFVSQGYPEITFWFNVLWLVAFSVSLYTALFYYPNMLVIPIVMLTLTVGFNIVWYFFIYRVFEINSMGGVFHFIKTVIVCNLIGLFTTFSLKYLNINNSLIIIIFSLFVYFLLYLIYLRFFERNAIINKVIFKL